MSAFSFPRNILYGTVTRLLLLLLTLLRTLLLLLLILLRLLTLILLLLLLMLLLLLLSSQKCVKQLSSQKCVKQVSSQKCVKRNRLNKNREKISHKRKTTSNFQKLEEKQGHLNDPGGSRRRQ